MSEHSAQLNKFAGALCAALTSKTNVAWGIQRQADHDFPGSAMISDGNRALFLYFPYTANGKVEVSGNYPDDRPGRSRVYLHPAVNGFERTSRPSINVGFERRPDLIAGDIVRRLLPDYEAVHAAIAARLAEDDAAASSLATALASMAAALDEDVPEKRQDEREAPNTVRLPYNRGKGPHGDFRGNHDGSSWTIKLDSVPTTLAEEIARTIVRYRQAN